MPSNEGGVRLLSGQRPIATGVLNAGRMRYSAVRLAESVYEIHYLVPGSREDASLVCQYTIYIGVRNPTSRP